MIEVVTARSTQAPKEVPAFLEALARPDEELRSEYLGGQSGLMTAWLTQREDDADRSERVGAMMDQVDVDMLTFGAATMLLVLTRRWGIDAQREKCRERLLVRIRRECPEREAELTRGIL